MPQPSARPRSRPGRPAAEFAASRAASPRASARTLARGRAWICCITRAVTSTEPSCGKPATRSRTSVNPRNRLGKLRVRDQRRLDPLLLVQDRAAPSM